MSFPSPVAMSLELAMPQPVVLDISGVSTSDYVIAIASIHKSRVANTVGRTYAIANYYVVTLIGIEGALAV
jgi:hypothetical protein